jgi:hypothetical protein
MSMRLTGIEGIDFVRCRSCGQRLRVISGRHLSKHDTERSGYMAEYGLSPDQLVAKDFRVIQSSRRDYRPYDPKAWVGHIKKLAKDGVSIHPHELQKRQASIYYLGVWLYGDWDTAIRAAGFDPEKVRLRRGWNKDKIIKRLRQLPRQNLPLYPWYVMHNHQDLFSAALRQYRSWDKALIAAGIKPVPKHSRFGLLRNLRDVLHARKKIPEVLRTDLKYYFGSVKAAKLGLKTEPRFANGWSKQKIVDMIARKNRVNESLKYAIGRREFPSLVSAAEAYFGSWGKALHAAGIDPNLHFVHHTWRKTKRRSTDTERQWPKN